MFFIRSNDRAQDGLGSIYHTGVIRHGIWLEFKLYGALGPYGAVLVLDTRGTPFALYMDPLDPPLRGYWSDPYALSGDIGYIWTL